MSLSHYGHYVSPHPGPPHWRRRRVIRLSDFRGHCDKGRKMRRCPRDAGDEAGPDLAVAFLQALRAGPFVPRARPAPGRAVGRAAGPCRWVRTEGRVLLSYAEILQAEAGYADGPRQVPGPGNVFIAPPRAGGRRVRGRCRSRQFIAGSGADLAIWLCEPQLRNFHAAFGWEIPRATTITCPHSADAMIRAISARCAAILSRPGARSSACPACGEQSPVRPAAPRGLPGAVRHGTEVRPQP
jgi:hypothetical protein